MGMDHSQTYKDCYFSYCNNILAIGNCVIERTWDLSGLSPVPLTLKDVKNERQWVRERVSQPAFSVSSTGEKFSSITITCNIRDDYGIAKEHLEVIVIFQNENIELEWVHLIYPEVPLMRSRLLLKGYKRHTDTYELTDVGNKDYIDYLPFNFLHCMWKTVSFMDVTDCNNNLVSEKSGYFYNSCNNDDLERGNLCFIEHTESKSGILLIKEGPTPAGHIKPYKGDFLINGTDIQVIGTGLNGLDSAGEAEFSYGCAVGLYHAGEENALKLLADYHNLRHIPVPERDFSVMSNTWGDCSQDRMMGEGFILSELDKAKELGVSCCQIDDGWETGVTINSLRQGGIWEGFYNNNKDFWCVDPERFPNGFELIAEKAREAGIMLGLWFAPDCDDDYVNWQKDAEKLIEMYKKYGFSYFKLDGVNIRSKIGECHLISMMRTVVKETLAEVIFNLDTTAQARLGYFGEIQYGNLFLENRYTDAANYYPHWTLRNLWMLSKYFPAQRLQMEFLNVERNAGLYLQDPLAPACCGQAYAFAVTMFSNPLAWMELSGLSNDSASILKGLIPTYMKHQKEILAGKILPIGHEPNGWCWTGLQSVCNMNEGYLLFFREKSNEEESDYLLWGLRNCTLRMEYILGSETEPLSDLYQTTDNHGKVHIKLYKALSFALYKYCVQDFYDFGN